MKITVTGINKTSGSIIGPFTYSPTLSGGRRRAHEKACVLRDDGYFVVTNDPYNAKVHEQKDNECGYGINDPVRYPYKVHSLNTVNQQRQGSHIGFVATLHEAEVRAKSCVKNWNQDHPGVVIFKAIKLVRMYDSPVEIIDL